MNETSACRSAFRPDNIQPRFHSPSAPTSYLMYKCSLNLNDAFNLVRSRKSNIAPNFHFMEQLHSFERELKLDVSSQSPTAIMEQISRVQRERAKQHHHHHHQHQHQQQEHAKKTCSQCSNCNSNTNTNPNPNPNTNTNTNASNDCKCQRPSTDFLSPLGQIGVSPDSGIEFDRWASSTPGTGAD